jgi:hypothetical protein
MAWYTERPLRYKKELEVLGMYYPNTKINWENGLLVAFHEFFTPRNRYLVKIIYPENFPFKRPKAYVVIPYIKDAPHRYPDGALSIHFDNEGSQISGKNIFDGAKKWIEAYEGWLRTGSWPERW